MNLMLKDPSLLRTQAFVDGRWIDADGGELLAVFNPATGATVAEVAKCGQAETRRAIEAAERAQKPWAARTAKDRAVLLRKLFDLMMANQDDLARILTAEQGKPLAEARGEIAYSANFVDWFSEEAKRVYGDTIPAPGTDKRIVVIKQAIGVVACITPWNFPSAMLGRKLAPALAAGCAVVCKPANNTPLSAFAIAALAERAGFPPGVINMVCGRTREIGDEMCANPAVRKLTFTGSTPVGKELMAKCAATVKRAEAAAHRRGQRTLDRDHVLADGVQRLGREPVAVVELGGFLAGVDFHPADLALAAVGLGDRRINNIQHGRRDIDADPVALDEGNDRIGGHVQREIRVDGDLFALCWYLDVLVTH